MELTKEHFEQHLKEQLGEVHNRLDDVTQRIDSIESRMATKDDLKGFATKEDLNRFATKDDLHSALDTQTKELQQYTDGVAATIIEAVDAGFSKVNSRLDIVESVRR